jgi:predicted ATP-grasp superfamily ATP-dependent carboligase
MKKSIRLLEAIEWEGAAMVEYRHDPTSGRSTLMEINGRFWGSQPLAYKAGAHFAWLTYAVLGLGKRPRVAPYRTGVRCAFLVSELKWLYRVLFHPELIENRDFKVGRVRALLEVAGALLDPRTGRYIFELKDPLPALADLWFALRSKALSPTSPVSAAQNL